MVAFDPFNLPDDELHFPPAGCVHQDGDQLWVPGTKDAVRPDGDSQQALLFVTGLQDQL